MPTFYAYLGMTGTQSLEYRWNGFCTDFNHVDGSDTFSGQMWLREGARYVGGTPVGTVPDFTLTVTGGSYDETASSASFMPAGQLTINETNLTRGTITGDATALSVTEGSFDGTFVNPDSLSGWEHLNGLVLYSGGYQTHIHLGSSSFNWERNLPACNPI